jgi:hypothetical protein
MRAGSVALVMHNDLYADMVVGCLKAAPFR